MPESPYPPGPAQSQVIVKLLKWNKRIKIVHGNWKWRLRSVMLIKGPVDFLGSLDSLVLTVKNLSCSMVVHLTVKLLRL